MDNMLSSNKIYENNEMYEVYYKVCLHYATRKYDTLGINLADVRVINNSFPEVLDKESLSADYNKLI